MIEKFKTLFFVKSSLIALYLALTIPIPFISNQELKIPSIILFVLGLYSIINITSDIVETCKDKISYKTSFISKILGRRNKDENFLLPQRLENFERFIYIIHKNTKINIDEISYLSPLWTYKLLTFLSLLMIIGELFAFIG